MLFLPKPGASPAGRHAAAEGYRQHTRPTRHEGARSSHATNAAVQVLGQRMCGTWAAHVIAGPRAPRALFHTQTLLPASSACPHQRSPRCKGLRMPLLCRKKLDHLLAPAACTSCLPGKAAGRGGNERNVSMLRGRARQHLEMGALTLIGCASAFALYGMFLLVRQASP